MTNFEFMASLYGAGSPAAFARPMTLSFVGDPLEHEDWSGRPFSATSPGIRNDVANQFFSVSTFFPTVGPTGAHRYKLRASMWSELAVVMFDDVNVRRPPEWLNLIRPAYIIETSPGNGQVGVLLNPRVCSRADAAGLLSGVCKAVGNMGGNNVTRWARLPCGTNGKPHLRGFRHSLLLFNPGATMVEEELRTVFSLRRSGVGGASTKYRGLDVAVTLKFHREIVLPAIRRHGLYIRSAGPGRHAVRCPFSFDHTNGMQGNSDSMYFEPSEENGGHGGYRCLHSHCSDIGIVEFITALDFYESESKRLAARGGE